MKHLQGLPLRRNRFVLVAFILVLTLVLVGLVMNSVGPAQAQSATYWWGTDFDWTVYRFSPPLNIPQNFYVAYLGSGQDGYDPNQAYYLQQRKEELDQASPPPTVFAYWTVHGPGAPGCANSYVIAPDNSETTLKNYGAQQAEAFLDAVSSYAITMPVNGNTLFVDIELQSINPPPGTTCDFWGPFGQKSDIQYWRNQKVLEGFLETIPPNRRGIYSAQTWNGIKIGMWPEIMGANYVLPESVGDVVMWLALTQPSAYDPSNADVQQLVIDQAQNLNIFYSDHYVMGGFHPTLWQFFGDKGSVSIQNPANGFSARPAGPPLPAGARGFYPNGIHVDYYNDTAPAEITLEAPINWDTFTPPIVASEDVNTINYAWYTNPPAPGVNGVFWSARYQGTLLVPAAGSYTFYLEQLDDGGRLRVNNNLIIDSWRVQGPHYYSATITLPSGQVPIQIEYAQGPGNEGSVSLSWSSDQFAKELIGPASEPPATSTPTATPTATPVPPTPTPIPPTPIPPTPIPPTPVPTSPPVTCGWEGCFWVCRPTGQAVTASQNVQANALSALLNNVDRIQTQAALLYRVRDEILSQTDEGQRYIDLYYAHSAELAQLMLSDANLEEQGLDVVDSFTPNLQALLDGQGSSATITAEQVQQLQVFLDALLPNTSPEFQQAIAQERARRPLEQLVGLTMDQAWDNLTQEPTPTPTPIPPGYPATVAGLRSLLKDLWQAGLVRQQAYKPMDAMLLVADKLLQYDQKPAALNVLRVFLRFTQVQSGHHITPEAAQQLIDLGNAVIDSLR